MEKLLRLEFSEKQQCFHVENIKKEFKQISDWEIIGTYDNEIINKVTSKLYDVMDKRKLTLEQIKLHIYNKCN